MTWFPVLLMILLALNAIGCVARIGRPREPITPALAVGEIIYSGLLILGIDHYFR